MFGWVCLFLGVREKVMKSKPRHNLRKNLAPPLQNKSSTSASETEQAGPWRRYYTPSRNSDAESRDPAIRAKFILNSNYNCCLTLTSIVGSLCVLKRLVNQKIVRFTYQSYRVVWPLVLVLCEKLWEDNYIHPPHIFTIFGFIEFPRRMIRNMQW